MVLWEITVATAYFLGLKRTYRLALRIQRRLIGPNHPKIRDFLHRRTRAAFDVAVSVHKNIQQRDIEVGRNLGNWILRWLDRLKPSAEIRPHHDKAPSYVSNVPRNIPSSSHQAKGLSAPPRENGSTGKLHFSPIKSQSNHFLTMYMTSVLKKPNEVNREHRHLHCLAPHARSTVCQSSISSDVFRKDIAEWILRH